MDGVFKKAVLGFHQAQVLTYIEQLNQENEQMSKSLLSQIEQLEGDNAALQEENLQIKSKIEQLDLALDESKQLQSQLGDRIVLLTTQINEQKSKLFQSKSETLKAQADSQLLNEELGLYKQKLQSYEDKEFQISTALIDAKTMAKKLVEDGRKSGEAERTRILGSLTGLGMDLDGFSGELVQMSSAISQINANFMEQIRFMSDTVEIYKSQLGTLCTKVSGQISKDNATYQAATAVPAPPKVLSAAPAPPKEEAELPPAPIKEKVADFQPTQPIKPPAHAVYKAVDDRQTPASSLMKSIQKLLGRHE